MTPAHMQAAWQAAHKARPQDPVICPGCKYPLPKGIRWHCPKCGWSIDQEDLASQVQTATPSQ